MRHLKLKFIRITLFAFIGLPMIVLACSNNYLDTWNYSDHTVTESHVDYCNSPTGSFSLKSGTNPLAQASNTISSTVFELTTSACVSQGCVKFTDENGNSCQADYRGDSSGGVAVPMNTGKFSCSGDTIKVVGWNYNSNTAHVHICNSTVSDSDCQNKG